MKLICVLALAIGGSAIASVALAQQADMAAPGSTPAAQAAPAEDPNEVVCRAGEPTVGSRIPGSRVCHTRKQWDDLQRDSARMIGQTQQQALGTEPTPGGGH